MDLFAAVYHSILVLALGIMLVGIFDPCGLWLQGFYNNSLLASRSWIRMLKRGSGDERGSGDKSKQFCYMYHVSKCLVTNY